MQRPSAAELFTAPPNSTGSNNGATWEASNISNIGFEWEIFPPYNTILQKCRVWFSSWYTSIDSDGWHNPFARISVYDGTNNPYEINSYIAYNSSKVLYFRNNSSLGDLGGRTCEEPGGLIPWTFNAPSVYADQFYTKILESGNGKNFGNGNNKYEYAAFYIDREVSHDPNNVGYEWIRGRANIKPRSAPLFVEGEISGKPSFVRPGAVRFGSSFYVDFDWDGIGSPTHIKIEFTANGHPTVFGAYHDITRRTWDNSSSRKDIMRETFSSSFVSTKLIPNVHYAVKLTPVVLIKDGFGNSHEYCYSDTSFQRISEDFVWYDPYPSTNIGITLRENGSIKSGNTFGIVRDYTASRREVEVRFLGGFNSGNANRCSLTLKSNEDPTSVTIVDNASFGNYVIPIEKISSPNRTSYHNLEIKIWNSSTPDYKSSIPYSNFISSQVKPLYYPDNLVLDYEKDPSDPSICRSDTIKLSWQYKIDGRLIDPSNFKEFGVSNTAYIILTTPSLESAGFWCGAVTGFDGSVKRDKIGGFEYQTSCRIPLSSLPQSFIGVPLDVTISPYFVYYFDGHVERLSGQSNSWSDKFTYDLGLEEFTLVAPKMNSCKWFLDTVSGNLSSQFRLAFRLPKDKNNLYSFDDYEYSSLKVKYTGKNHEIVEKTYSIGDNSTLSNSTYICVSGDGKLSHQNSVIVDLTGINNSQNEPLEPLEENSKKKYLVEITVTSKFGTSNKSVIYNVTVEEFPLKMFNEQGGIPKGEIITPENMSKFLEARDIVATFTDGSISEKPIRGNFIKYRDLSYMVKPVNDLYYLTLKSNFGRNVKSYFTPRALDTDGSQNPGIDVPFYNNDNLAGVNDSIYAISADATSLSEIFFKPYDYDSDYAKYFQQSLDKEGNPMGIHGYVWRSSNNNLPSEGTTPSQELYIRSKVEATHLSVEDYNAYIAVPDKNLYANYKYKIDWRTKCGSSSEFAYGVGTVIGGSFSIQEDIISSYDVQRAYGIFVGVRYGSREVLALSSCMEGHVTSNVPIQYEVQEMGEHPSGDPLNARHPTTFKLNDPVDPNLRTTNGFCLFQGMDYRTGAALNGNEHQYPATCPFAETYGVVYSVKVYDSDDNLIMHFVPRLKNGHIGMVDLIDDQFYPCNDDSKFELGSSEVLPIYYAEEYNASWSYYSLYRNLQTKNSLNI